MIDVIIFLCLIAFVPISVFNIIVTATENKTEENMLKYAFASQVNCWENSAEEINLVGRILLMIFLTIFFFPSNILLLGARIITFLGDMIWKGFKWVFKKRKKNVKNNLEGELND